MQLVPMAAPPIARRSILKHLLLTLTFQQELSYAQGRITALPLSNALRSSARQAVQQNMPLVVMFTLHGCTWCDFVRNSHLLPLIRERGIHVVEVDISNSSLLMQDFDEVTVTHKTFAQKLGVKRTPTLLFFDAKGTEVAPRLVGVSSQEYYGAYLEQRIEIARQQIHPT